MARQDGRGLFTSQVWSPFDLGSDLAPSESGAIKKAEAWASREKGVAAVKVTADDETGEVTEAVVLSSHGQVPEDFADQIRGG